jgi:hypothetical protein
MLLLQSLTVSVCLVRYQTTQAEVIVWVVENEKEIIM